MTTLPTLSPLTDPVSLAKLQILLVPVHTASSHASSSSQPTHLTEALYTHWTALIKRHTVLRGDELRRPVPPPSTGMHVRGGSVPDSPRLRFFPASSGASISRAASASHVHLAYPSHPPARHLYPLSLLRLAGFPLVVIGIAVEQDEEQGVTEDKQKGYSLSEEAEDEDGRDDDGDIGEASTPVAPTFRQHVQEEEDHRQYRDPLEAFENTLGSLLPPTSPFPLVKRLVFVPKELPQTPSPRASPSKAPARSRSSTPSLGAATQGNVQMLHAPMQGAESWVVKVLGEVVGEVLGELGELATALETPAGLKTLSSTLLPSLTSTAFPTHANPYLPNASTSSTPVNELPPSRPSSSTPVSALQHAHSVDALSSHHGGMGISLNRALTPGGRPTSVGPPSLPPLQTSLPTPTPPPLPHSASSNPFRRSTAITSPFSRTNSAASASSSSAPSPTVHAASAPPSSVNPLSGKYTSAPLSGVAGGRLLKLLGDMYLLAGMFGDAIRCFDEGAERARTVGDVLWEGLAREGRAVAGIGEAWEARDGSNLSQAFPAHPIPVEILSHYLSALACLSRAPLPFPPTILSPSPQAISGKLALPSPSLSSTRHPSSPGTGEGLLAWLYTSLALRISHFMLLIWSSGGWGSIALSSLMSHSLPRSFPVPLAPHEQQDSSARRRHQRSIGLLSAKSQIPRAQIVGHAESALGPHSKAMTTAEQLAVWTESVWLARWTDSQRKEASYIREAVRLVGGMVVQGRDEMRRLGAGGFTSGRGREPAPEASEGAGGGVGLGLGMPVPTQAVAVRRRESTEGNAGVIALFQRAATMFGIDLLASTDPLFPLGKQTSTYIDAHLPQPRFGWPELQVEVMKEGIAVAEALPDHAALVRLCASALKGLHGYLNAQSQSGVVKMMGGAMGTVKRRGLDGGRVGWWVPGRVVLSLEVASLAANRIPIEHSQAEMAEAKGKDPFLYNPRLKAAEAGKTILVVNEQVDVFITLQNPFLFDLDIQDVSLITSGTPFTAAPLPLTLPATSVQTIRLSGIATSPGPLSIRGVSLRLPDGAATDVLLPVIDQRDKEKRDKRRSRQVMDLGKNKRSGTEARWSIASLEANKVDRDGEGKWLECEVVEEQPVVWVKRTSLSHGTVMLYNGESSVIRITLENSSSVPVDFVKLSFDDSASRAATQIVAEGELASEQAYELEHDVLHRPVFVWENEGDSIGIPPNNGRVTLSVKCLGKVGCTDGSITIDYGYVKRAGQSDSGRKAFHTRQITLPLLFTVYHTLEPHSLDIARLLGSSTSASAHDHGPTTTGTTANGNLLPIPNGKTSPSPMLSPTKAGIPPTPTRRGSAFAPAIDDALRVKMDEENDESHCLVGISVRNVYGVPFEVALERRLPDEDPDQEALVASRLIPPGATERIYIPVPRLPLSSTDVDKPIPALSERQYVVDKAKKGTLQIRRERELFWYREALLKMLAASWTEPGSKRCGTLSLRDQILTPDMLDILRMDGLEIHLEAECQDGQSAKANEFVELKCRVVNKLERAMRPMIRIEPLPSSSAETSWASTSHQHQPARRPTSSQFPQQQSKIKNIIFDGILSKTLPVLQPGDEAEHTVAAVFLASGTFAFRAAVEDVLGEGEEQPQIRFSPILHVQVEA